MDSVDSGLGVPEGHTENLSMVPGLGQSLAMAAKYVGEVFAVVVAEVAGMDSVPIAIDCSTRANSAGAR
nr:hypothetical protein GCM10010200_044480 [Actinomadura rugatobispora]